MWVTSTLQNICDNVQLMTDWHKGKGSIRVSLLFWIKKKQDYKFNLTDKNYSIMTLESIWKCYAPQSSTCLWHMGNSYRC